MLNLTYVGQISIIKEGLTGTKKAQIDEKEDVLVLTRVYVGMKYGLKLC